MKNDASRLEHHRETLTRALCVPYHADAAVTGQRRAQRFLYSHVHRMKLVIAGHLLGEHSTANLFEHDKVADQIEEAALQPN